MKRGILLLVSLLVFVSTVEAGFLFEGSVWDELLSGNLVRDPYSNKDLAVTDIFVDQENKEVLARVCNTGTIGVNHNNLRLAIMTVNGVSTDWSYPQSKGYDDTPERRALTTSSLQYGACILLAQSWDALKIADDPEQLAVSVQVDPDSRYMESDDDNNLLAQTFVLRESVAAPVIVRVDDAVVNREGTNETVTPVASVRSPFSALIVVFGALLFIVFFLVHKRKLMQKHRPLPQ